MALNYEKLKNWPFEPIRKTYTEADAVRFAQGFGAVLPGALQEADELYLDLHQPLTMPGLAVALADGEFWQQHPEAGLQWQKIVHVEEVLTLHAPLAAAGDIVIARSVEEIFDRGAERGALFQERETIRSAGGTLLATIDVATVAKGDGGFGGQPEPRRERLTMPERPADEVLDMLTPIEDDAIFRLPAAFDIAGQEGGQNKAMLRGLCAFGMAARAVLKMVCNNQPERLRRIAVRYAGPMYVNEVVRVDLWRAEPGRVLFCMRALERDALILNGCSAEYSPAPSA